MSVMQISKSAHCELCCLMHLYNEFPISSSNLFCWTVTGGGEEKKIFCLVTETSSQSPESQRTPCCYLVFSANEWPNEFRKTTPCSAISLHFSRQDSAHFIWTVLMHKRHCLTTPSQCYTSFGSLIFPAERQKRRIQNCDQKCSSTFWCGSKGSLCFCL